MWFVNGFVNVASLTPPRRGLRRPSPWSSCVSSEITVEARAPPMISSASVFAHLAVGLQVGLDVLLHRERHVRMTDPLAERLPVDLRIAARGGVAVPHVVQVDFWQTGRRGELLEPSRDRVRMRRPAVRPAEQARRDGGSPVRGLYVPGRASRHAPSERPA